MAFLKLIASLALGGGIGYGLLCLISPDESDIKKHLPPYSSEKRSIFKGYKSQESARFMNDGRQNANLKQFEDTTRDNTDVGK